MVKTALTIFFILCFISLASADDTWDTITFATYYPSPYGVYNEMNVASRMAVGDVNRDGKYDSDDLGTDSSNQSLRGSLTIAGNVGIETTNPTAKLDVRNITDSDTFNVHASSNSHYASIIHNGGGSGPGLLIETAAGYTGAGAALNITSSDGTDDKFWVGNTGNVGIGTASPTCPLQIVATNSTSLTWIGVENLSTTGAGAAGIYFNADSGIGQIYRTGSGYSPGPTNTLVIQSMGSIISPVAPIGLYIGANEIVHIDASPNYGLTVNGKAYCTSGLWNDSDLRLKENVKTLDEPIGHLMKLRGVQYDWKRKEFKDKYFPEGRQIGIIAQEMEKEFPELITTDSKGYKAIAYDRFTAVLLEAIKSQENKLQAQEERIKALETKISTL